MIAPIGIPSDPDQESDQDPEDSLPRLSESESDQWEEHQRRQKSIRTLMMFLMMLILMEGENPPDSNRKKMLRAKRKNGDVKKETMNRNRDLLEDRRSLDKLLGSVIRLPLAPISGSVMNSEAGTTYVQDRYQRVIDLNQGIDEESRALQHATDYWTHIRAAQTVKRANEEHGDAKGGTKSNGQSHDEGDADADAVQKAKDLYDNVIEGDKVVWTYPRNATGSYRGQWTRVHDIHDAHTPVADADMILPTQAQLSDEEDATSPSRNLDAQTSNSNSTEMQILSNPQIAGLIPQQSHIGLHLLPPSTQAETPKRNINSTDDRDRTKTTTPIPMEESLESFGITKPLPLEVTNEKGSIIIRLYSRPIDGMNEISLIDGIVNLYDVNDRSFTSQMKHLTLRVRGVVIHSLGRISLVANDGPLRSVFVVKNYDDVDVETHDDVGADADAGDTSRRKLMQSGNGGDGTTRTSSVNVEAVRDEALRNYNHLFSEEVGGEHWRRHLQSNDPYPDGKDDQLQETMNPKRSKQYLEREYVGSNPFLPDDDKGSLFKTPPKVMKSTPPLVTLNGHDCEFELDFNITETQWTVGDLRKMYQPVGLDDDDNDNDNESNPKSLKTKLEHDPELSGVVDLKRNGRDEALVVHMLGTVRSAQCNFISNVNVTAVRTDWEQTTNKSINYCFIMMVACLAQTVFLLKQLIYSQPQSAAVRVSLLSVGWHTLLDALLCVEHVFLCLLLQPVSTAFGMVAFLKLLIFCVIEMKYMVIVMQAQLNAAGHNLSATELRRKISGLHFRFYCALIAAIVLLWHFKDSHRTLCLIVTYSFWVPQIIQNIKTEAKRPLHIKYVYGMSITRLVAPIYTLAMPKNLFTEIEPEFPVDYFACQMLILWVGFQSAILIGQSKYGTRFMIPARFLPPKFDYHRPIPAQMRPKISCVQSTSSGSDESESSTLLENDVMICGDVGPRKRKEKRSRNGSGDPNGITTINHTEVYERPTLDCVICYNDIDIGDRMEYMLAPCNHIFHRHCLTQWMDVKMECPTCRTNLPAL